MRKITHLLNVLHLLTKSKVKEGHINPTGTSLINLILIREVRFLTSISHLIPTTSLRSWMLSDLGLTRMMDTNKHMNTNRLCHMALKVILKKMVYQLQLDY